MRAHGRANVCRARKSIIVACVLTARVPVVSSVLFSGSLEGEGYSYYDDGPQFMHRQRTHSDCWFVGIDTRRENGIAGKS